MHVDAVLKQSDKVVAIFQEQVDAVIQFIHVPTIGAYNKPTQASEKKSLGARLCRNRLLDTMDNCGRLEIGRGFTYPPPWPNTSTISLLHSHRTQ